MALALLCPSHPSWLLLCPQSGSGCPQWVSQSLSIFRQFGTDMPNRVRTRHPTVPPLCASVSLQKSVRRHGHAESSRSCESASSWMKTFTATWSGLLTLRSWMLTVRGKVSHRDGSSSCSSSGSQNGAGTMTCSPLRAPAPHQRRFRYRQPV